MKVSEVSAGPGNRHLQCPTSQWKRSAFKRQSVYEEGEGGAVETKALPLPTVVLEGFQFNPRMCLNLENNSALKSASNLR